MMDSKEKEEAIKGILKEFENCILGNYDLPFSRKDQAITAIQKLYGESK